MTKEFGLSPKFVAEITERKKPFSREEFLQYLATEYKYPQDFISLIGQVDRSIFLPPGIPSEYAYTLSPWPIVEGNKFTSLSDPLLVAMMTRKLNLQPGDNALEIGTATGYQTAIISKQVGPRGHVTSMDINPALCKLAERNLKKANITGVEIVAGDGSMGYEKGAPPGGYDRIIVTASMPPCFPLDRAPLTKQLAIGGELLAPFGFRSPQDGHLIKIKKMSSKDFQITHFDPKHEVRFVPLQGKMGWDEWFKPHIMENVKDIQEQWIANGYPEPSFEELFPDIILEYTGTMLNMYGKPFDKEEYLQQREEQ